MNKREELISNLKNTLATLENKKEPSDSDKFLRKQIKRKLKKLGK